VDTTIDDTGTATLPAGTAWRWFGLLTAPANPGGTAWQLKVFVQNQASSQLFVDGLATSARQVNLGAYPAAPANSYAGLAETARSHDPAHPALQHGTYSLTLAPGAAIHLDLRLVTGVAPAQIQLRWVPPDDQATSIGAAVSAAASARTVVVFAYDEGTEGRDRGTSDQVVGLTLPGYQDALISAVAAANPHTVVVLNTRRTADPKCGSAVRPQRSWRWVSPNVVGQPRRPQPAGGATAQTRTRPCSRRPSRRTSCPRWTAR
jgi:beta-glucosidase